MINEKITLFKYLQPCIYICSLENLPNENTRSAVKQYHKEHQQRGQGTSTCT